MQQAPQAAVGAAAAGGNPQQPAPPQPQPNVANPFGVPVGHTTYAQYYDDPTHDPWNDSYGPVYQQFDLAGGFTPQNLRNVIYATGNNRVAVSLLVHVRDHVTAAVDDPGVIILAHRLTRFVPPLQINQPPFPDVGHGFVGDVLNHGQAPMTVELPDRLFARINQNTQVPDYGLMEQLIAADPDLDFVGPFPAGTADCSPMDSREAVIVPNPIARMFLNQGHKPRAAFQAVYGALQAMGQVDDCAPLLDWLRLAMTRPAADQPPRTASPPLVPPVLLTPAAVAMFHNYRLEHLHHDLPGITPGALLQIGQVTHHGFAALTHEQRLTRQEAEFARTLRTARKKPLAYYGDHSLDLLLRLAHVGSEADLPPVHEELANHNKSQTQRLILQRAVHATMDGRGYQVNFPVTTSMAQKVQSVSYSTIVDSDFSQGLHIFNMGALSSAAVSMQDQVNRHSDAIYGNSVSPSLDEVAELTNASKDVVVPRDTDHLRAALQRVVVLYETLLGPQHPLIRAIDRFMLEVSNQASELKEMLTLTGQTHLVPVFAPKLARWFQVEMNAWLQRQKRSLVALPAPDFTRVLDLIRTYSNEWDRPFPVEHLVQQNPYIDSAATAPPGTIYSGLTTVPTVATSIHPSLQRGSASSFFVPSVAPNATLAPVRENTRIRNEAPDPRFLPFQQMNIKMATLKANLASRTPPVPIPTNAHGAPHCLAYHVKAVCNTICGAKADHRQLSEPETVALLTWCTAHHKIVE